MVGTTHHFGSLCIYMVVNTNIIVLLRTVYIVLQNLTKYAAKKFSYASVRVPELR